MREWMRACVLAWIVNYLTGEHVSINTHQKEMLLATSSQ